MIVRALKLIGGRHPAGAVIAVDDAHGRRLVAVGLAEPAPDELKPYATGPQAEYRRPKAKTKGKKS